MNKLEKWRISLLKSLQLQLFISLMSLPFLISWGLPISILSIVATIIFGPFLTAFLLVSSCIFFCELFHLPNALFIWLLEKITTVWMSILNINQQWWLIGFANPPLIVLVFIVPCTLAILHNKQIKTMQLRIIWLMLMLIGTCTLLTFFPYRYNVIEKIYHNNSAITLINHDNNLTFIDPGVLSARPSFESFILYNLIPEIIQKTGKMTIEHLVICKINKRTFDAITFLSTKISIKNIYLPWWTGKIPSFAWSSYVKLKKAVFLSGGKIVSVSKKRPLFKVKDSSLFVEPSKTKSVHYYNASYPLLLISGSINKHTIEL